MSFEDLLQLLILGGAALAWLLGGTKSKKAPPQQRPPPRQRARTPTPDWKVRAPEPTTRIEVQPRPRERLPADTMADEIYRILSGETAAREREESLEIIPEEALPTQESLEEIREVEAYSLETLEPAGEASHRRFHQKYLAPLPAPASARAAAAASHEAPRAARPRHPALGPGSLRDAILWHEILGPPKAFKD